MEGPPKNGRRGWRCNRWWLIFLIFTANIIDNAGLCTALHRTGKTVDSEKKNVLFLVVDDMRPNIGAYNATFAYTPHMDKLASQSLLFKRAYANYAYCAPSRNSFMTGRLPDVTRTYNFVDHFREPGVGTRWRTLPQYFKQRGYTSLMAGKVFHKDVPPNYDFPTSWSNTPAMQRICNGSAGNFVATSFMESMPSRQVLDEELMHSESELVWRSCVGERTSSYCAADVSPDEANPKKKLVDQRVREDCIEHLQYAHNARDTHGRRKPFFVACGFHRPHTPWVFPAEFLEHIPEDVPLPKQMYFPKGIPKLAFTMHGVLQGLTYVFNGTQDPAMSRLYRRGYYASISWVDYNVGKVLSTLSNLGLDENTLVVLTADHGYALGEMGMWTKMTNFENALRVPLICRAPWIPSSVGASTNAIAALVDVYPTIAGLAGLPDPRSCGEEINGISLVNVFHEPYGRHSHSALSQFAKPSLRNPVLVDTEMRLDQVQAMGYSVRMERYRYSVWFGWDLQHLKANLSNVLSRELYDYSGACPACFDFEPENEEGLKENQETVNRLHAVLISRIRGRASIHAGVEVASPFSVHSMEPNVQVQVPAGTANVEHQEWRDVPKEVVEAMVKVQVTK